MRAQTRPDLSMEGVPLTLTSLLSAYGRHRRISLRVENLPERARLSRGRNNGDRSWSLMRDELDDLVYLPPQGNETAHTLSVRVINLEGDGETLALHELAVDPSGVQQRTGGKAAAPVASGELRKLREELAGAKAALKARERELADEQAEAARARAEASQHESALADARVQFDSELKTRLAAAEGEAASRQDASRAAWAREQSRRFEESEARAQQRLEDARACWQQESEAALVNAKLDWKSAEAARMAAAEAQWRVDASRVLVETEARFERAQAASADARAQLLRETEKRARGEADASIARAKEEWKTEWDTQSARARAEAEARLDKKLSAAEKAHAQALREVEERAREETEAALKMARDIWKNEEASRLAAAESEWRSRSDSAASGTMKELERLNKDLAQTKAHLAARERELAVVAAAAANADSSQSASQDSILEARRAWEIELAQRLAETEAAASERLDQAQTTWNRQAQEQIAALDEKASVRLKELQDQWQAESAVNLARAREAWCTEEASRLVEQEARWRARSEQSLEDLRRELTRATAAGDAGDVCRLNAEVGTLKAALSDRDADLSRARNELARSHETWSEEEAARFAAAEAKWRERSEQALASVRREYAENGKPARGESAVLRRENAEFEKLQAILVQRDSELAEARGDFTRARERWKADLERTLDVSKQAWLAEEEHRLKIARAEWERETRATQDSLDEFESEEPRQRTRFFRDGAVGVLLAAASVLIYQEVAPVVAANGSPPTAPVTAGDLQPHVPIAPPPAATAQIGLVIHGANLRAAPSSSATVVTTLSRGRRVSIVGQQGEWTHVRIEGVGEAIQEGWVFGSYLKNDIGALPTRRL